MVPQGRRAGKPRGAVYLADMYNNGAGVQQDYATAAQWYRKAADQDNASAQLQFGSLYENGRGVEKNLDQAIALYRKSADQGYALGQAYLADMYFGGTGIQQGYTAAAEWYAKPPTRAMRKGNSVWGSCTKRETALERTSTRP